MKHNMYIIYLKEEDLLTKEHIPVAALINEAANSDIIEFVNNLVNGVGSGYNYSNCSFWNDLDEYDQSNTKKFEGLRVSNEAGEEVIISYGDLLHYLETICARLAEEKYDRITVLQELLDSFKKTYC